MPPRRRGETGRVFAVALAFVVIGLVLGFLVPPYGFAVSFVGLILLVLYLFGVGRAVFARGERGQGPGSRENL